MKNVNSNSALMQILSEISDFRNPNQITYELPDLLIIILIGVMSGMTNMLFIGEFAKYHSIWFKNNLGLTTIPSHDTLERVLTFVSHAQLEAALTIWLDYLLKDKNIRKRISFDGKKINKRSRNRTDVVRAFVVGINQVKGSVKINAGENEIVAIPKLIKKLFLKGYLVSIDAIGTQTSIVKLLLSKGADYLLPVKRNQKLIYEDIQLYAKTEIEDGLNNENTDVFEMHNKGHGRIETRKCYTFYDVKWLTERYENWGSIKSFSLLKTTRKEKNKKAVTTFKIYISNLSLIAKDFLENIRLHWAIENNLHWNLNYSFLENKIKSKNSNFVFNFSLILGTTPDHSKS